MADFRDQPPSLPLEGRVQEARGAFQPYAKVVPKQSSKVETVRKQFIVREDGALAYHLQNEEFEEHYGHNRYQRRVVREDIPVARVVQTEEEIELQKERLRKLAALQAQAEADEIVARKINRQVQDEVRRDEIVRAIEDEELARQLQEKEKAKYERYMEKKKERKLKKEREKLEQQLAKTTEEARLALPHNPLAADQARQDMAALRLQGASPVADANGPTRVTPAGRIEDDGDFSDFFATRDPNIPPEEWEQIQQQQDLELARLLQEQEHKRNKAEVDRAKLREIELRDEQLAAIMQEQEKLREKKYKEKRQRLKEQQKLERQHSEGLPLGASASMFSQGNNTTTAVDHNHHRYRRNSYTKSIDNGPGQMEAGGHTDDGEAVYATPLSRSLGAERSLDDWMGREKRGRESDRQPQNHNSGSQSQGPTHRTIIQVNSSNPRITSASKGPSRRQVPSTESSNQSPEVMRWLESHSNVAPSQNFEDDTQDPRLLGYLNNNNNNSFNIATAIDPTYHRRQKQPDDSIPQVKSNIPLSRSLPVADGLIEWEPGVRGSLRRLRGTLNPLIYAQDTPTSADGDSSFEDGSMNGTIQPVQGQKRSTVDNRTRGKARKSSLEGAKGGKNSGNCKQQ